MIGRSLRIGRVQEVRFIQRLNRFLVEVELTGEGGQKGQKVLAHLRDPGRLKELLVPEAEILVRRAEGEKRKTSFEVVAVKTGNLWVLVNSGLHPVLGEIALNTMGCRVVRREFRAESSRFDFLCECGGRESVKTVVETKGCTLVVDGTAYFPDAPTERGARHLEELARLEGYGRLVLFLVVREDAVKLKPNRKMDERFGRAFDEAADRGVEMKAARFRLRYEAGELSVELVDFIPVER